MSFWVNRSLNPNRSIFDDKGFEYRLLQAERYLHYTSTHLDNPEAIPPVEPDEGLIFSFFKLLIATIECRPYKRFKAAFDEPRATLTLTWIGWIIAAMVAIIGITFTTLDFVRDFRDPIRNIELVPETTLRLPVLTLCSTQLDIPAFPLLNRSKEARFQGMPLFTARSIENFEEDSTTFWPDTLERRLVTPAYRGPPDGSCLRRFRTLDARDSEDKTVTLPNELLDTRCQYCFQIGRERPITLRAATSERNRNQINPLASRDGVRLHLVMFPYRNCLLFDDNRNPGGGDYWDFVKTEIARAAPELQERGILDFSNAANLTDPDDLDRFIIIRGSTPEARAVPFSFDFQGIIMTARDMVCHVFFWSDFFFPQETAPVDVRYRYNTTTLKWDRIGTGPFLRERRTEADYIALRSVHFEDQSNAMTSRPVEVYMEDREELDNNERLDARSEQNLVGADFLPRVGDRAERIATIDESQLSQVLLTRVENKDNLLSYSAQVTQTDVVRSFNFSGHLYLSYFVNFKFDSFFTEKFTMSQQAQWPPYFADVFGYVSVMMGVTMYHLLIAPVAALLLDPRPNKEAGESDELNLSIGPVGAVDKSGKSSSAAPGEDPLSLMRITRHFTGVTEPLQRTCSVAPTRRHDLDVKI